MALAVLVAVFVLGAVVGASSHGSEPQQLAERYAAEWSHGEWARMYGQLDRAARSSLSERAFAADYREALRTATATSVAVAGSARSGSGGVWQVPLRVRTRIFGTLRLPALLTVREEDGGQRIAWTPSATFPGVAGGARLARSTELPPRAKLLAREGSVLAEGTPATTPGRPPAETNRASPLGSAADAAVGALGPAPAARRAALAAEGVPADAPVGISGLELALDARLRGTPGGTLLAGKRILASSAPRAAAPVRTSISPSVQQAAAEALGSQYGGVVVLDPRTGQILAVAGIALEGLQPPGSTFKMVTVSAALKYGVARPSTVFPYATYATLDGVKLANSKGEECGGSLVLAFAVSCNSVFAPLGVKIGASHLVATAEAYGFNSPSPVAGAAESTIPPAHEIQGELDLGSTAIGQGEVLASPLEMARIAATIGDRGRRPTPTFTLARAAAGPSVTSARVAAEIRRMMVAVVTGGTGTAAAIPGVTVAGKTGTAELGLPCTESEKGKEGGKAKEGEEKEGAASCGESPSDTDAWFAAFAPALHPRVAVGVLLVKDGFGGETAAPVARQVIEAALAAHL
ncbi:MAG TPA: penicillin-binding transpeptidase domain-containing protein [Solirubrobacteraceae bacterium]|nr:penicillin-binding transpeptidase domain-containing protein [Solirubrobacteraceae bacterium]